MYRTASLAYALLQSLTCSLRWFIHATSRPFQVLWGAGPFRDVRDAGAARGCTPAREFDEFMIDTYLLARSDGLVGQVVTIVKVVLPCTFTKLSIAVRPVHQFVLSSELYHMPIPSELCPHADPLVTRLLPRAASLRTTWIGSPMR